MLLTMEGISKAYGDHVVLNDVDFFVRSGQRIALLGDNGSGKTTLLRIAAGFSRPDSGRVRLNGIDVLENPAYARRFLGYIPQKVGFPGTLSVLETLRFFARIKEVDDNRVDTVIGQMKLDTFIGKKTDELSGGMLQRLALAVTFLSEPAILLLDEPTVGLDYERAADLHRILIRASESGCAVVVTTHKKDDVDYFARRFAVVDEGKITAGRAYAGVRSSLMIGDMADGGGI